MATRAIANLLEEAERRKEEKKLETARKRIKQVAAIIVVLVIALTCAILSASSITAPSKPKTVPIQYTQSEFLTSDDKEIITELRTSFVPTTRIILPPTEEIQKIVEKAQMELIFGILDIKLNRTRDEEDMLNFSVELGQADTTSEPFEEDEDTTEESASERRKRESDSSSLVWKSAVVDGQNATGERETWDLSETGDGDILDYDDELSKSNSEHDETKTDFQDDNYKFSDIFQSFWKGEGDPESIRKTQGEVMRQYMDMNADPCEDFYQYACGNWTRHNPIPADKAGYDTFEMLRENLDIVLRDLLISNDAIEKVYTPLQSIGSDNILLRSEPVKSRVKRGRKKILAASDYEELGHGDRVNNNVDAITKAKYLYESCMNYEIIENKGHQPLEKLLDELGGWPIITPGWNDSRFDWVELMAKLRLYNNDILISEWVGPDMINSNEFVLHLDQTSLGLPTRDYFLQPVNQVYLDAYMYYLVKIATLLGSTSENALKDAKEIIIFETKLARISSSSEERRNITHLYKRLTVQQLIENLPKIDWKNYLSIVLDKNLTMNEVVLVYARNYIEDLVTLLEQTDNRTISNYLLWRFVRHRVNNLDDRFQEAKQKFYYILFGREQSPPRWKNCVLQVNTNLGMALGSMFVNKYFNENSKNDTLIIAREIQRSFRELLNMTSWIDNGIRSMASDKVDSMLLKIGYPGFILNNDELNEHYQDVYMHPETYFENTLNILRHLTRIEQSRLGQVVNKTVWNTAPAVVNAYYSRNKNHIMFPAGILQPPLYHRYFPKSLNYGGIGVVIGHEITHGFDDKGRLFDKYGNLNSWWDQLSMEAFHEKAQCIIDQYDLYTVSEVGMSLDGANTQGENIADNGGIKQAFRAYLRWLEHNNNQDETLPGLKANNKQLFFLNFAQVWCGSMRPEAMKNKLKTAMHSPGRFRVIGTLSNSEDFAQVYQCPKGSPMNPAKKCNVW